MLLIPIALSSTKRTPDQRSDQRPDPSPQGSGSQGQVAEQHSNEHAFYRRAYRYAPDLSRLHVPPLLPPQEPTPILRHGCTPVSEITRRERSCREYLFSKFPALYLLQALKARVSLTPSLFEAVVKI